MNIKDQVLSIEQVQELQELGFDINKYASVEINTTINKKQYVVLSSFVQLYPEFGDDSVIERYSTMTIGDIIECLPKNIKFEGWEYDVSIYRNQISYYDRNIDEDIFVSKAGLSLINALFECLVWCIKEKHIEL